MNRRQWYEDHTRELGTFISQSGITPNQLTLLSLLPAGVSSVLYMTDHYVIGGLFVLITLSFDVLDGSVARATHTMTNFGGVLDPSIDRVCEFIILLGIMVGDLAESWIVFFCFSGMIMASYVRAKIETMGVPAGGVGLMERFTKLMLIALGSAVYYVYPFGLSVALLVVGALSFITAGQRLIYARGVL